MILGRRDRERLEALQKEAARVPVLESELRSLQRELERAEKQAEREAERARDTLRMLEDARQDAQRSAQGWMSLPPEVRETPEADPEAMQAAAENYRGALARIDEVTEAALGPEELRRRLHSFREDSEDPDA